MLAEVIVSALLAQSPQSPSIPSLSPDWQPAATQQGKSEYARYVRKEQDESVSSISGARRVCDCDPSAEAATIAGLFARTPGVTVARATVTACGQQAQRIILTGHASQSDQQANNIEVLLFREEPAFIMLTYAFRLSAPLPDDESALLKLCPV